MSMSLFRPGSESVLSAVTSRHSGLEPESPRQEKDPGSKPGMTTSVLGETTLHEAVMDSVSSVRDSLPKEHHEHFETLRQEIIDFAKAHDIPRESLAKPNALREAAEHLSIPDLQRLATLLERFEYLLVHHEPKKEDYAEALEYAERLYHLKEQYTSQVALLEQVGILKDGVIEGIDGNKYPVPTLEQIASRLFERREGLSTKHDQGFTKLLLVPFGMSLDSLYETLEQFLFKYRQDHPDFDFGKDVPLWKWGGYQEVDGGEYSNIVYYPKSFNDKNYQSRTKTKILEEQEDKKDSFPGWMIHLFQPSDLSHSDSHGLAHIPFEGRGAIYGREAPRKDIEAGKTPEEYLSILKEAQDNPNSPYFHESGMTPEDWIIAFMTHLTETGQLLDNHADNRGSDICLVGSFFHLFSRVPYVHKDGNTKQIDFDAYAYWKNSWDIGTRFSVIV